MPCLWHTFNSSPPSDAYTCMLWWIGSTLVQIMACRPSGAKSLSKPILVYCQLDPWEQLQWNFNQNKKLFIQENAFAKMAAIFFRGRWVNTEKEKEFCWYENFCNCLAPVIFLIWLKSYYCKIYDRRYLQHQRAGLCCKTCWEWLGALHTLHEDDTTCGYFPHSWHSGQKICRSCFFVALGTNVETLR